MRRAALKICRIGRLSVHARSLHTYDEKENKRAEQSALHDASSAFIQQKQHGYPRCSWTVCWPGLQTRQTYRTGFALAISGNRASTAGLTRVANSCKLAVASSGSIPGGLAKKHT